MVADVLPIVTKVYLPILMPFVLLLMSLLISERIVDAIKAAIGR